MFVDRRANLSARRIGETSRQRRARLARRQLRHRVRRHGSTPHLISDLEQKCSFLIPLLCILPGQHGRCTVLQARFRGEWIDGKRLPLPEFGQRSNVSLFRVSKMTIRLRDVVPSMTASRESSLLASPSRRPSSWRTSARSTCSSSSPT